MMETEAETELEMEKGEVWTSSMWLYLTLMHYVDVGDLEHSGFGEPCMIV